jgi:hydroxymethylbilane synthase
LTCQEKIFTTRGDRILDRPLPEIGGKGLFTEELERELLSDHVDVAVHSLKDLPIQNTPGLVIGMIPKRADASDVLISPRGQRLEDLPQGAVVGTSSIRRQAQLLAYRPDLQVQPLRGNVDTRVRKVVQGQYDAIILASAGVTRLGLDSHITQRLSFEIMLPAPGQGALAIQCRDDDQETLELLSALEDENTRAAVEAEREFLSALGGGCSLPIGAYTTFDGRAYRMMTVVGSGDGHEIYRSKGIGKDPIRLGKELAQQAIQDGALELMHV